MLSDWRCVINSGAWEKGKIHRHGSYNYYDAKTGEPCGGYVCQFRQNLRSGRGTYTLRDGSVYDGDFRGNVPYGYGSFRWPDGSVSDVTAPGVS
ncbi:hypothetical protein ACHAWF_000191 [Thalassiosira exigua]